MKHNTYSVNVESKKMIQMNSFAKQKFFTVVKNKFKVTQVEGGLPWLLS